MPASIWKDYVVSFGNVAEADYSIYVGSDQIFSGHAVRRPDEAQLTVRINDVCADYLAHVLPSVTALTAVNDPAAVTFTVKNGSGTTIDTVQFVADWSFDHGHSVSVLADPVNGRVSAAQALVASVLSTSAVSATLTYRNGTTATVTASNAGGPLQAVTIPLASYSNLASVTVNGKTYTVVPACARYALLYVNAFGGWDTLLMEGRSSEVDGYDRHLMEQRYDNGTRSARGTVEYANEVQRAWTLRTGWLSDAQAARMHHALGSTHAYLYDITGGYALPVVVTDTECQYKTYRGNGGQLVNYTLDVRLAQSMARR